MSDSRFDDAANRPANRTDDRPDDLDQASLPERRAAQQLGQLVDDLIAGTSRSRAHADAEPGDSDQATPAELAELATMIRANAGREHLSAARAVDLVEMSVRKGAGIADLPAAAQARHLGASRRWLPWAWAGVATAAAAALALAFVLPRAQTKQPDVAIAPAATVPTAWQSRSPDDVVGRIDRASSGRADQRIDAIFADRLDGYRDRRWSAGGKR